jgi:hypothetical protein
MFSASGYVVLISPLIIHTHCTHIRLCNVDQPVADAFFKRLEREAFRNMEELLCQVPAAAQRLWTSNLMMQCVPCVSQVMHALPSAAILY